MSIKNIKICHLTYKTVCSITFFPLSLEMQIIQFFLNYKQTWRYAYSSFFFLFCFCFCFGWIRNNEVSLPKKGEQQKTKTKRRDILIQLQHPFSFATAIWTLDLPLYGYVSGAHGLHTCHPTFQRCSPVALLRLVSHSPRAQFHFIYPQIHYPQFVIPYRERNFFFFFSFWEIDIK